MASKKLDVLWTINYLIAKFSNVTKSGFAIETDTKVYRFIPNPILQYALLHTPNDESDTCIAQR